MNTKSLENAIDRMIEKLPGWNEDAIIYEHNDGTFDCDPRSTYETIAREHPATVITYECHSLDEIFPGFGSCEDDAAWLLAQIINRCLGTGVSTAASILGSVKSDKKATASRENGKLGGRPKKSLDKNT